MIEFPEVFRLPSPSFKSKSEAANAAKLGWSLCQEGEKIPERFGKGMEFISKYLGAEVSPDNCHKLWVMNKIKEDRKSRGMTQVQYADLFNVKENTVQSWENGRREPATYFWFLITLSTEALQVAAAKSRR